MDGQDSEDPKQSTADMTVFVSRVICGPPYKNFCDSLAFIYLAVVQNLLQQMGVLDEMGARINELEQSINDLRAEMGAEGSPSPLPPSKKPDDVKLEEGSA
ncbi:unnamed protein product [Camellia sinensis]